MGFTAKQQAFINEYLKCRNATEAALRAGYSERTAYSIGHENLKKPEIAAEIKRRTQAAAMGADEVLQRLSDQARATIEDFTDVVPGTRNVVLLNFEKAAKRDKLHLIKKLKYNSLGYPEIELHDAQSALVQVAKLLGLSVDRVEVDDHRLTDEERANRILAIIAAKEEGGN